MEGSRVREVVLHTRLGAE